MPHNSPIPPRSKLDGFNAIHAHPKPRVAGAGFYRTTLRSWIRLKACSQAARVVRARASGPRKSRRVAKNTKKTPRLTPARPKITCPNRPHRPASQHPIPCHNPFRAFRVPNPFRVPIISSRPEHPGGWCGWRGGGQVAIYGWNGLQEMVMSGYGAWQSLQTCPYRARRGYWRAYQPTASVRFIPKKPLRSPHFCGGSLKPSQ